MVYQRLILFGVLAVFIVCIGSVMVYWLNRPMSQSLTLKKPVQIDITQPTRPIFDQKVTSTYPVQQITIESLQTPIQIPADSSLKVARTCGNYGIMRLLVIGLTIPSREDVLGADAIRLVTVNFDLPSSTVMNIPAMLWVKTPVLSHLGIEQYQLSGVYAKAYMAAENDTKQVRVQKATQALAQTIIDNFGYTTDHYIVIDDEGFVRYVNALGGVEITLSQAVDGSSEEYGLYPVGPQHLDGTRALNFARLFHPNGKIENDVWGNLERQNMIVKAILAAILKPKNLIRLRALVLEARQAVTTDLSLNQALDLACMVQNVGENARMLAVSEETIEWDEEGRMIPNGDAIRFQIWNMDRND